MIRLGLCCAWGVIFLFAIRLAVLGRIGADVRAFQLAYVAAFVAYVALLWLVLRSDGKKTLGSWAWWFAGCIAIRLVLMATSPSDDLHRYIWEGRVQLAGFNPYRFPPEHPALRHLRTESWARISHKDYTAIYGPLAQVQFCLLAAVDPSPQLFKAAHVLWDGLVIVLLAEVLRRRGQPPHGAVAYALCPLVLTAFGIEGHVDSLMLLCIAGAVWATVVRRPGLAAAMVGLAVATKIAAIVLLPWFLAPCIRASLTRPSTQEASEGILRRIRPAGIVLAVSLLCYLPYWRAGRDVLASAWRFSAAGEFMSLPGAFGLTQFESPGIRLCAALLLVLLICTAAIRIRAFPSFGHAAASALLMLMPVVHYWYVSWVLVFAPLRLAWRWLAVALAMVVYFDAGLAQEMTGVWRMPAYASPMVWISFVLVWTLELRFRGRATHQTSIRSEA